MNAGVRLARALYTLHLRLYPTAFRAEFGAEMQDVFAEAANRAAVQGGWLALTHLCWRELRDWPAAVLREHARERRPRLLERAEFGPSDPPVSPLALWVVLAVFMLPVIVASPDLRLPWFNWVMWVRFVLVTVLLLGGLLAGLLRGLPRWALPHTGLALSIPVFIVTDLLLPVVTAWLNPLYLRLRAADTVLSRLAWSLHYPALFWLVMLAEVGLIVALCAAIQPLRPFYRRLRQDWTQVSFVLYGASLVLFVVSFDDYQHEFLVVLVCVLGMAAGAWAYLRSRRPGQRLAALLLGGTLMLTAMGVGKWLLVPLQDWPQWFQWHPAATERWFEALSTIPAWICLMLALSAPLAVGRLVSGPAAQAWPWRGGTGGDRYESA